MPTFRLNYGSSVSFDAQVASEVVSYLRERHMTGGGDGDREFLRRLAIEMAEWSGEYFCWSSEDCLADSMMRHGLLEVVD